MTPNDIIEIKGLIEEYKKTEFLLRNQRWEELQQHLQSVLNKHPVEVVEYNMMMPYSPPSSLQENAVNCMTFLKTLLLKKGIIDLDKAMRDY